jgi:hypothetical protein
MLTDAYIHTYIILVLTSSICIHIHTSEKSQREQEEQPQNTPPKDIYEEVATKNSFAGLMQNNENSDSDSGSGSEAGHSDGMILCVFVCANTCVYMYVFVCI